MNKDFSKEKLLSFNEDKVLNIIYSLAKFIEKEQVTVDSTHFQKLKKYHGFLSETSYQKIQKLNKEFKKVIHLDYQFQVYIMNLERFLGQSLKEYDFLVKTNDSQKKKELFNIVCVLDSIRSAHNVGSMLRNAECFGVSKVYLTGLSPKADHPQVSKTAMGCEKIVDWEYHKDALKCIEKLKDDGYKIVSIETAHNATPLHKYSFSDKDKIALIFGHEQHGVSLELLQKSDESIIIDLFGNKNSLNVSVSQAITLFRLTNRA